VKRVGAIKNTTGDVFIKRNFQKSVMKKLYPNAQAGIEALKRKVIDAFIHDAPAIIWLSSENEADISAIWEPLNEEYLAWGVRKSDENLRLNLNAILERWKKDGTLQKVLHRWLPPDYCECFK
jgi:polar amino acid transport system substrate-binding protein